MSAQYITLKKSDPDFLKYLWGRLGSQRALPVKSYNIGTDEELVTFEIKELQQIQNPAFFTFVASLIKLNSFVIIVYPLFYVLVKNYISHSFFNPLAEALAAVAALFLYSGLSIRNDIFDHISGYDRVNIDFIRKPIRLGWIGACQAAVISWVLIIVSALFALPAVLLQPELLKLVGVALVLFIAGSFVKNNSYKQRHFGEFILFILVGPTLVSGYQVALGAGIDTEALIFGILWGAAVLYLIQINNFSHIMTSSQAQIKNSMTSLGFDRAQKFLKYYWFCFIGLWMLVHFLYADKHVFILSAAALIFASKPLLSKLSFIKSPMGSGLNDIKKTANKTFLIVLGILLVEDFYKIWAAFI